MCMYILYYVYYIYIYIYIYIYREREIERYIDMYDMQAHDTLHADILGM